MMKNRLKFILLFLALTVLPMSAQTIDLVVPDTTVNVGDYVNIPVRITENITGLNIVAYQLQLSYRTDMLHFESTVTAGTLTGTASFSVNAGSTPAGILNVAAAGATPLSGNGALLFLRFKVQIPGYCNLSFTDTLHNLLNEGAISLTLHSGQMYVPVPPQIYVSPEDGLISVGETLQYNAYYGETPYTWSVANPDVAGINADGLVTGLKSGKTKVIAKDHNGIIDTSIGFLEVRAAKLFISDTTVLPGSIINIPVYASSLTGLGIVSGVFTVSYDSHVLTFIDVVQSGSILSAYQKPVFRTDGSSVQIAFAGSAPLAGSGVFLFLRMQISSGSAYTSVQLTPSDILFNENILIKGEPGTVTKQNSGTLSISSNQSKFETGDTLRFYPSGGFPPYTFSVTNDALAGIDASGLLKGKKGGILQVKLKDNSGDSVYSGPLTIYDSKIYMRDTSVLSGIQLEIPFYIDRIPSGNPVYSFELKVYFDTTYMEFLGFATTGALTDGWAIAVSQQGNYLNFAGASATAATSGGKFLKMLCGIKNAASPGQNLSLYPVSVNLNEGSPWCDFSGATINVIEKYILPAPSDLLAKPTKPGMVTLTWKDNSSDETGFILERKTGDSLSTATYAVLDTLAANQTTCIDSTVLSETKYTYRIYAFNNLDKSDYSNQTVVLTLLSADHDKAVKPIEYCLMQNYPNPFNPSTVIRFDIPQTERVTLRVYNVLGKEVMTLINAEMRNAGRYNVSFNASELSSGIYFYKLEAGKNISVRKMILLK